MIARRVRGPMRDIYSSNAHIFKIGYPRSVCWVVGDCLLPYNYLSEVRPEKLLVLLKMLIIWLSTLSLIPNCRNFTNAQLTLYNDHLRHYILNCTWTTKDSSWSTVTSLNVAEAFLPNSTRPQVGISSSASPLNRKIKW